MGLETPIKEREDSMLAFSAAQVYILVAIISYMRSIIRDEIQDVVDAGR